MIRAINAPLASGKTFTTAERAVEALIAEKSTLIFEPTHAACDEFIGMVKRRPFKTGYLVHLRGKSEETCLPAHHKKKCARCPVFRGALKESEDEAALQSKLRPLVQGRVLDLSELWTLGREMELCPLVLGRALAMAPGPRIVVTSHAYLASKTTMDVIQRLQTDDIVIDEADILFETLLGNNQRSILLAEPRQRRSATIQGICDRNCKLCVPHFADPQGGRISPRTGRIESLEGIWEPRNIIEALEHAIGRIEDAVKKAVIIDAFNFLEIRRFITALLEKLSVAGGDLTTREYLQKLETASSTDRIEIDVLDPLNAHYAIPIPVGSVVNGDYDGLDDNKEDQHPYARVAILKNAIFINPETPRDVVAEIDQDLTTFLHLVDFLQAAPGQVYLFPEKRSLESSNRGEGYERCRLLLRYINETHYKRATDFLSNKTKLLSGTLLDRELVAASLLISTEDMDYKEVATPCHESVIIIVHNTRSRERPKPIEIRDEVARRLYLEFQRGRESLMLLHFSTNTELAREFFKKLDGDSEFLEHYRVEFSDKNGRLMDRRGSFELGEDRRTAFLCIDKLRSSTSRAVNREQYDICTVIGNGIANWSNRIPQFLEARKQHPELQLSDLIHYEQKRSVIQALMRAPRSRRPTVCFYAGNLHPLSFPKFLRNRIVTTQDLVTQYCAEQGIDLGEGHTPEVQIQAIADAAVRFLGGEEIEPSRFLEVMPAAAEAGERSTDTSGTRKTARESILDHIEQCIKNKGVVERVADKRGERGRWNDKLDSLVAEGVLKEEKDGKKIIYKRVDAK